jgi:NAD(P)-dependent dehydrogenase (short-subunit alcohol dehydrogenase family)
MSKFQNKVAIITGSSRGIGKAIAIKLAKEGVSIVLNGRNNQRLLEAKSEIEKIHSRVVSCCCDVSDPAQSKMLIDFAMESFGRLDILINNVGISNRGTIAESKPEVFQKVFESNVFGSMYTTIEALPHIRKTKGSIVFISSVAGIRGLPSLGPYCASKMALRSFAETLRIEEHTSNIHVGLIQVGITEIEHQKEAIGADGKAVILADRSNKKVQTTTYVAEQVFKNIRRRKFITTLSRVGKLNAFLQPLMPLIVEKIIIRVNKKFEAGSK